MWPNFILKFFNHFWSKNLKFGHMYVSTLSKEVLHLKLAR